MNTITIFKKCFKLSFAFFALFFLFLSCSNKEIVPEVTINTSSTEIETALSEIEGGSTNVSFTVNTDWVVSITDMQTKSENADWISVYPTSGSAGDITLNITTEENNSFDERSAQLSIIAGEEKKAINITQNGCSVLYCYPNEQNKNEVLFFAQDSSCMFINKDDKTKRIIMHVGKYHGPNIKDSSGYDIVFSEDGYPECFKNNDVTVYCENYTHTSCDMAIVDDSGVQYRWNTKLDIDVIAYQNAFISYYNELSTKGWRDYFPQNTREWQIAGAYMLKVAASIPDAVAIASLSPYILFGIVGIGSAYAASYYTGSLGTVSSFLGYSNSFTELLVSAKLASISLLNFSGLILGGLGDVWLDKINNQIDEEIKESLKNGTVIDSYQIELSRNDINFDYYDYPKKDYVTVTTKSLWDVSETGVDWCTVKKTNDYTIIIEASAPNGWIYETRSCKVTVFASNDINGDRVARKEITITQQGYDFQILLSASDISSTSATLSTSILNDAGLYPLYAYYCWSENPVPTKNDYKSHQFYDPWMDVTISNLTPETKYYYRIYIETSKGEYCSDIYEFTTTEGTCFDHTKSLVAK